MRNYSFGQLLADHELEILGVAVCTIVVAHDSDNSFVFKELELKQLLACTPANLSYLVVS
jgi:hypothetical protein